jgi:hypothetical protein
MIECFEDFETASRGTSRGKPGMANVIVSDLAGRYKMARFK